MASSAEFVQFVFDQISSAGNITCRKMFGEYGFHRDGKYFACICDDQFFVKITNAGRALMPHCETAPPYEGAKPCFVISKLDDKDFLADLIQKTCDELPAPKPKKKKTLDNQD